MTKVSMPMPQNNSLLATALAGIEQKYREKILSAYHELKVRHERSSYSDDLLDAIGLSAGKFCESVLRWIQHEVLGESTPFGTHIPNFPDECRKIIGHPSAGVIESLKIVVPRALVFLYTMRGKRGIGHVGGDVEANAIDLRTMVKTCDWVVCELIRVYHKMPLEEAQALVDSLAAKEIPLVWEIAGKKRVLKSGLSYRDKTLLLLYSQPESSALTEDLKDWAEHPHMGNFRRDVLRPLHELKRIEYDSHNEIVYLSPLGVKIAEEVLSTA